MLDLTKLQLLTYSYVSYSTISCTFSETQTVFIDVIHNDITSCCINNSTVIRCTNIEYFGKAVITKRMTLIL